MLSCLLLAAAQAAAPAPSGGAPRDLPFSQGWELKGDAAVGSHDGRETLSAGTGWAYRRDVQLRDGTVELDLKVTARRSFVYVTFRMEDEQEYEELYLRPHKSALPDAVQYAPVRQGKSAWQLHHGPGGTAAVPIEHGKWTHLRLVLRDRTAALYLGSEAKPAFVARLDREPRAGYLALRAFAADGAKGPVAWFSSVRTRPEAEALDADLVPPAPVDLPGVVKAWAVSEALAPLAEPSLVPPPARAYRTVPAEPGGLVSLLRHVKVPPEAKTWTTSARLQVRAEAAGPRQMDLGWSDTATVYLNGRPLFHADARYSFDRPRQEGLVHLGQASVFLPLQTGDNELVVVVSDVFGGWAVMGRFPDDRGLRVEAR
ncbi:MAG TPA: hypothetical protein VI589_14625 [Vicinamibacteria bacterium]